MSFTLPSAEPRWLGAGCAGALAGLACVCGAGTRRGRWSDFGGNLELEGLHRGVLLVLLGFLDFDLGEIAGTLQRGDEIGDAVDGSRGAVDGQVVAFANHRSEPQILGARDGAGDLVQQFLAAGAIALQLFDGGDALLQDRFLLLEGFDLLLDLFEVGLLRLQLLDRGVFSSFNWRCQE